MLTLYVMISGLDLMSYRAEGAPVMAAAVRFDDQFPIHRKIATLSAPAFRLQVEAICWSARNLTDGLVRADELVTVTRTPHPRRYADELVRRGLWHETPEGWEIHDYLDWQPSRDVVRTGGRPPGHTTVYPAPHPFAGGDDGDGSCARCHLPRGNHIHTLETVTGRRL
jgi:hypothetical protein